MNQLRSFVVLLGTCALLTVVTGLQLAPSPGAEMRRFAVAWLESLDAEQRQQAKLPYDTPQRVDWHFIPKPERKGVPLRDMNAAQRTAALRLVRAALSEVGYEKTSQIMLLEGVIRRLEGPGSEERRDPMKYYVTIFGDPAADNQEAPWGLSFEGHHLSLNFVCSGDRVLDAAPQFFGSNPAEIKGDVEGPLKKGTRVLRQEEVLAFGLLESLDDAKQKQAIIADEAPEEIRFAGQAQPEVTEPEGISFAALAGDQQESLRELIQVYATAATETVGTGRLAAIERGGWDNVHFAWAGAKQPGVGHYYRIQGPSFLIELVNTQPDSAGNPANHIHCVWRDMTGDFNLPIE